MDSTTAERQEQWLVLRAQAGDVSAWDGLVLATQPWLYGYLRRLLGESHAADDVLQAVLLLIFRKLRFLHEPRVYRSWVYRIATREAVRSMRRERSRRFTDLNDLAGIEDATRLLAVNLNEPATTLSDGMRQKIEQLGPNTKAVIILHYFEDLSLQHVADVLDLSVGTVKSRLAYGLMRLRQAVGGDDRDARET